MVFTEIKDKSGKKYYYRIKSGRKGAKVVRDSIYLGANLNKKELKEKENEADKKLLFLNYLLTDKEIKILNEIKKKYSKESKITFENRYEAFCSRFTYDSTSIEGNTLTLQETARLLFEERVPSAKTLREINEILNHRKAFDCILDYKGGIAKEFIFHLHKLVVTETLKPELNSQIGKYRELQVYIRGTDWLPPKPSEVAQEMKTLLSWYSKNKNKLHPLIAAAYFHAGFETIHPFIDGNGRVGRLLINFILHKNKFPMINIPNKIKHKYYNALEDAQLRGNLKSLLKLLFDLMKKSELMF